MEYNTFTLFIIYILVINFISFFTMYLDKKLSIKKMRRISEKSLFMLALFLGSLGSILGMYTFRHKTKHATFTIGMPLIFVFNIICIYLLNKYGLFN